MPKTESFFSRLFLFMSLSALIAEIIYGSEIVRVLVEGVGP